MMELFSESSGAGLSQIQVIVPASEEQSAKNFTESVSAA